MSDKNNGRLIKKLSSVKTSLAIEGLHLTDEEEKLIMERANKAITKDEFLKKAKELADSQ